ncbi:hypothetical protein NLX62_05015, partial [Mycobacteriaceae bacterium Msp059]|nr:hypothetical protein [Mycobacteriaceae bacterium Msp059]
MKVWNGTDFVDVSALKVWNGSAFVDPEAYVWDGSQFVKVWPTWTPFNEENINRTNQPVPVGASGCWVTLVGGGNGGYSGVLAAVSTGAGGRGGGGGAKIFRIWIPVTSLGPTYSVNMGTGGAGGSGRTPADGTGPSDPGAAGGASSFSSGSISLTANGGSGQSGGTY